MFDVFVYLLKVKNAINLFNYAITPIENFLSAPPVYTLHPTLCPRSLVREVAKSVYGH